MKYPKKEYDLLRSSPLEENQDSQSFSEGIRHNIRNNRMEMFCDAIDYLEQNNIEYEVVEGLAISTSGITLGTDMKVKFGGGGKTYQYNLQSFIKRLNK